MSNFVGRTSSALLSLAAFAACGPALAAGPDSRPAAEPLRICADPANMPFSSDDPAKPGLYLEIGDAIGKALDRPVTHVWYRTNFGKRAVRVTMLANQCDATIGLPQDSDFMGPRVIFSKPLFNLGYALVAPQDFAFNGLDSLKGKRVIVQYETTPQNLLAPRNDLETVTVLSPEEGMKKLADGKADAAFIWGATAGYLNATTYGGKFKVTPTDGTALSWPTSVAFAKGSEDLRDKVDASLPALQQTITGLVKKYGLPADAPVKFGALTTARVRVAAATEDLAFRVAQAAQPAAAPAPAAPAAAAAASLQDIAEGKEVFNGTCAHCHGPDAIQSEKRIDLRRLTLRYDADAHDTFWKTVHEGRPSKGMPSWKDVFTDEQFNQIWDWLQTVQSKE
ncbi:MAG: transporter substrate-binding domain-containing protein [Hyphomicrobiales bacterium]|nr:transporter substrate-binding domain-containing protein [Hyphomicrobiales bacterium]